MGYPFDGYVVSVSVLKTPWRDVDISDNQNFSEGQIQIRKVHVSGKTERVDVTRPQLQQDFQSEFTFEVCIGPNK